MWKDINGWEGLYEASTNGEVRNKITGHILVGDKNSCGYSRICLYNKFHNPSKQRFLVHRLIAETFIPNPNNFPEVNHKDLNINNNKVENLEWCTREYNELHSRIFGKKEYKPFKVVFDNGIESIYNAASELAEYKGVTRGTVKAWLNKRNTGFMNRGISKIEYI